MKLSPPSLHAPIIFSADHQQIIDAQFATVTAKRQAELALLKQPVAPAGTVDLTLTTVALAGNFDASINVLFEGMPSDNAVPMIVDTGNTMLIVPRWEDIAALPNSRANYRVLGDSFEPWGSPAKVVVGPVHLPTTTGGVYTIPNCVFYACTGAPRTANFGAGRIQPWNTDNATGATLQSPLSFDPNLQFAEFIYEAATSIFAAGAAPTVSGGSMLRLHSAMPANYSSFSILPNLDWMALIPQALKIGTTQTGWPDPGLANPIAMIDTGGGPVFLSDPNEIICNSPWQTPTACPTWAANSTQCECVSGPLVVKLGDGQNSYSYAINTKGLPGSVQGLSLVMCKVNEFMRNKYGMNIGGISALFNNILIDYNGCKVGFQPRTAQGALLA